MEHVRPPQSLSDTGNMSENWCRWKQQFELFMDLTENTYVNQPQSHKAKLLLNLMGPVGFSALDKITFKKATDKEDMHILLQKFDAYFNPPKNEIVERHNFFTEKRNNNISLDDYINKLQVLAKTCNFGQLKKSMIRDKVILDIKDKALLQKIFNTKELDLKNLVEIIENHNSKSVSTKESKESNTSIENSNIPEKPLIKYARVCWRCKKEHPIRQCPAYNNICESCGERGHINDPHACRISFLKKKQDKANKMDDIKNVNTNMSNLNMNVLDTKKENNFSPSRIGPVPNTKLKYQTSTKSVVTATRPSAPPLSEINSLYPDLRTMEPNNLPFSTTTEASNKYVTTNTNVPLVQTQCPPKKVVSSPKARNTRTTKHSNDCILS